MASHQAIREVVESLNSGRLCLEVEIDFGDIEATPDIKVGSIPYLIAFSIKPRGEGQAKITWIKSMNNRTETVSL